MTLLRCLLVSGFALLLGACMVRAGNPEGTRGKFTPYAGLSGRVVDTTGHPVAGAKVESAGLTAISDTQGHFALAAPTRFPKRLTLRVTHPDFATAALPIAASAFQGSFMTARLRPVLVKKRLSSAQGGAIVLPGAGDRKNGALLFPPGFLATPGDVDIAVAAVQPFAKDDLEAFPGSFEATVPGGQGDMLETLGTLEVQITRGGEAIAEPLAKKAILQLRLSPTQATRFGEGATVPAWWLDETTGVWQPEGSARVITQNGVLMTEFSAGHFTWWNADRPLSEHACFGLHIIAVDDEQKAFVQTLAMQLTGYDYEGWSAIVPFDENGVAVGTGWRGHRVAIRLVDRNTGQPVFADPAMQQKYVDTGIVQLSDVNASSYWNKGPGGVPLIPTEHCVYQEKSPDFKLGTVTGIVRDGEGLPAAGVLVSIDDSARTVVTGDDGAFAFNHVPWSEDGSYAATVRGWLTGALISPVTLVRTESDQAVELMVDVPPAPPVFTTVSIDNSVPKSKTSVQFTADIVDDRSSLQIGVAVCGQMVTLRLGTPQDDGKVTICHVPPGNPKNEHTISVAQSAVDAHLAHGDYLGVCKSAEPATPPAVDAGQLNGVNMAACTGTVEALTGTVTESDGEYRYHVTGKWKNGNELDANALVIVAKDDYGYSAQALRWVYWRNSSPVVSIAGDSTVVQGEAASFEAIAHDPDGDAVTFRWNLDGAWLPDTTRLLSLAGLAPGPHYVTVEVSDGHAATTQRLTIFVTVGTPATGPETIIDAGPPALSPDTTATLSFHADAGDATFECALDSGSFAPCTSPYVAADLAVGLHTFAVRAVNAAGTDASPAIYTWEIQTGWTGVYLGYGNVCALQVGALYCWGYNSSGELGMPPPASGLVSAPTRVGTDLWRAITLDPEGYPPAACGIKQDDSLWCWGGFAYPATYVPVLVGTGIADVRVHFDNYCALGLDYSLWCWGYNDFGVMGDGTFTPRGYAQPVSGNHQFASFGITYHLACAVDLQGALWCWGASDVVPGFSVSGPATTPQRVGSDTDWLDVDVGYDAACARKADRTLWCWGTQPRSGFDDIGAQTTPRELLPGTLWRSYTFSTNGACGVSDDDVQWCWGTNTKGALGGDSYYGPYARPVSSGVQAWASLAMAPETTCGVRNRLLYCWGGNWGELFPKGPYRQVNRPYPDLSKTDWVSISGGANHSCAIDAAGDMYCWGKNENGAVGDGTTYDVPERTQIGAGRTWTQASTIFSTGGNESRSCAIDAGGLLWCWGDQTLGALGNGGTIGLALIPENVDAAQRYQDVALGAAHGCGVTTAGALRCWGQGAVYRLGNGSQPFYQNPATVGSALDWAAVEAGETTSCALKTDRSLWCWGGNVWGEAGQGHVAPVTVPTQVQPGTVWRSISLHREHVCGIRFDDGSLWCWGYNELGQLGNTAATFDATPKPVGIDLDWASVATGPKNTFALKSDGSLWAWGDNAGGKLGLGLAAATVPTPARVGTETGWTSMGPGWNHTCAVRAGVLYCMGNQLYGEFGDQGAMTRTPRLIDWP